MFRARAAARRRARASILASAFVVVAAVLVASQLGFLVRITAAGGGGSSSKGDVLRDRFDEAAAAAPTTAASASSRARPSSSSVGSEKAGAIKTQEAPPRRASAVATSSSSAYDFDTGRSKKKRVYACGYDYGNLHRHLFPDYVDMGRLNSYPPPYPPPSGDGGSVVVMGLRGPCRGIDVRKEIVDKTPGVVALYINGETGYKTLRTNGPPRPGVEYGPRVKNGYFGTMSFIGHYSRKEWDKLFLHEKKPVNTGERYLVYLALNCVHIRERAFDALSKIGRSPAYHGKCQGLDTNNRTTANNTLRIDEGEFAPRGDIQTDYRTGLAKVAWLTNHVGFSKYRFCLVMENTFWDGYITEKIFNAFLGGCVPVWYGTREIFDVFNRRAFVYYDAENPTEALKRVAYLERNRSAYDEMVRGEPILANGMETIRKHFSYADDIGGGELKGRIRKMIGVAA